MAIPVAIVGPYNTGKSYSRSYIQDGENTFLLKPSEKSSNMLMSNGEVVKDFDIKTANYNSLKEYMTSKQFVSPAQFAKFMYDNREKIKLEKENILGNMQLVKNVIDIPIWLNFVSEMMPWVHTIFISDFTHYISRIIAKADFINRKAGGESYQKFWELAADSLNSVIISMENKRRDLIIVTEYHTEWVEERNCYDIFSSAGKMLKEKFMPFSYYDYLFGTHTITKNEGELDEQTSYYFVTRHTTKHPYARSRDIFKETYIPNNLQEVLTKIREKEQITL